eukprot:5959505-Pleurochrysis_carterae.AAC.1
MRLNVQALCAVVKLLRTSLEFSTSAEPAESELLPASAPTQDPDPYVRRLLDFCESDNKTAMAGSLGCSGCVATAEMLCLHGACAQCSCKKLWSETLRPALVH